ncbi:MAG TPA: PorV/PorQ family protein [Bacteroidetes bacterium]|nr:PorV/PorQ family protein [Bacteroidota bacterium]
MKRRSIFRKEKKNGEPGPGKPWRFRFAAGTALWLMVWAVPVQAGVFGGMTKSGTTAGQFLKIPVGARAIAMGGAYSALASDVTAIYWNPAGLARISSTASAGFAHARWLAGTNYDFAAAAVRLGSAGTVGVSFISLTMPDMPVRTEFEPEGTGEFFSAMDFALGVSFARAITDRFRLGFNAKYVREQIWHMAASALALDIGILFRTDFDWLTLGVSVSNFGPKMRYEGKDTFINYDFDPYEHGDNANIFANLQTDRWDLPLLFRFGLAFDLLDNEWNQLKAAVEARHPNDNTENVSFGVEYGFRHWVFFRAGYQSLFEQDRERGLTAGFGIRYYLTPFVPLFLDYAYADWGRLTSVHRFSFEIRF